MLVQTSPALAKKSLLGSSQTRADTVVDKVKVAQDGIALHLDDRFGVMVSKRDLQTTTWAKFDQEHPHISNVGNCASISLLTETG